MDDKRAAFVNAANATVNRALREIQAVSALAKTKSFEFTNSDVEQIFSAISDEVALARSEFARSTKGRAKVFQLSNSDNQQSSESKSKRPRWAETYETIVAKRDFANLQMRPRQRRFFSEPKADYLAECVARTLACTSKPRGVRPRDWAIGNPKEIIVVDARDIIRGPKPTLASAPQLAIRGRLVSMFNYAEEVRFVGYCKAPAQVLSALDLDFDPSYAVVLYREASPIPFYKGNGKGKGSRSRRLHL